ncbi:MAG: DUF2281 domain-containing protein [Fimbriimonas sp.]
MGNRQTLTREIESLPETLVEEVLDFILFVKLKRARMTDEMLLAESSLARDWLRPEEERAWANL